MWYLLHDFKLDFKKGYDRDLFIGIIITALKMIGGTMMVRFHSSLLRKYHSCMPLIQLHVVVPCTALRKRLCFITCIK